jgi:hypothetical protein
MRKQPSSPKGLKSVPLWQWGLLLIVIGPVANMLVGMLMPPPGNSDAARGQAFGRGLVAVLSVIIGVVLIAVHFVRRGRR